MRRYAIFFALASINAVANESHCTDQEQIIFSCRMAAKSSKVVSLCASRQLSKGNGRLTYRFGPLGKVELEYPSSTDDSLQQFRFAHYFRFQTDRTEVSFTNGKFSYSVFDYYDEQETPQNSRGISINNISGQGRETQLLCGGKIIAELQKLEGVVPCDTNSELATCNER